MKDKDDVPLNVLEAIDEAGAWNRADLRSMDDITPNLSMLKARAKVLRSANRDARKIKIAIRKLDAIFNDMDSTNDQEHDATVALLELLGWEPGEGS